MRGGEGGFDIRTIGNAPSLVLNYFHKYVMRDTGIVGFANYTERAQRESGWIAPQFPFMFEGAKAV